jgi:hypothetical protein
MAAISLLPKATALLDRVESVEIHSLQLKFLRALLAHAPTPSGRENVAEDILNWEYAEEVGDTRLKSLANSYYCSVICPCICPISLRTLAVVLSLYIWEHGYHKGRVVGFFNNESVRQKVVYIL